MKKAKNPQRSKEPKNKIIMQLGVKDRLLIPGLIQKEGTYMQFNLKKSILAKIEFNETEREELNFSQDENSNMLSWDVSKETPLEPMLTTEELAYLKECCEKRSEETLADELWATVEKIYNAAQTD